MTWRKYEEIAERSAVVLIRRGRRGYPKVVQSVEDELPCEESALDEAMACLRSFGVEINLPIGPARAVLTAEAVNLAAKELDYEFYGLKPACIDEAASWPGVSSGWGADGAFHMHAPGAGTCSFHDPGEEINSRGAWPLPWTGVSRQWAAFDCLADLPIRRQLAVTTAPKFHARVARHRELFPWPMGTLP